MIFEKEKLKPYKIRAEDSEKIYYWKEERYIFLGGNGEEYCNEIFVSSNRK